MEFEEILEKIYSLDDFDYSVIQGETKICAACGKSFVPFGKRQSLQRFCKRSHYLDCLVCGKPVFQKKPSDCRGDIKCTCSKECGKKFRASQTKSVMMKKYGVENPFQVEEFRAKAVSSIKAKSSETNKKIKATLEEKYGGIGTGSPILKEKIEKSIQEKYGVANVSELPEIRKKISEALKSSEVVQKKKEASRSKWGFDYPAQSEEVQQKMRETTFQHYGVPYTGQILDAREKAKDSCLARYGVPYGFQTEIAKQHARESMIANNTGRVSKLNLEFMAFLQSNGIDCITEKYISGKWYDIEVTDKNIVLEIDPTYTHSSLGNHWISEGLDPGYQLMKTELAAEQGYRCIHVFDWDSWDKILDLLKPCESIYARRCEVVHVDFREASEFIDRFHIQGQVKGTKFAYGLKYQGDLISVMTLGKSRYNKKYQYEILRLCSKPGVSVIGGPSKMLKAFIKEECPESIISYCDRSKFQGTVYTKMGMELSHTSAPSKVWSKETRYITDNYLRSQGYDRIFGTDYGKGTSNEQLMLLNGWAPVYDCGQFVYTWEAM